MKKPLFCYWLTISLVSLTSSHAFAHETEVCLQQLAQAAQQLRICRVGQTSESQCDAQQDLAAQRVAKCRNEQFPEEFINRAIAAGDAQTSGDPSNSPYQQHLRKQQRELALIGPNLQRFAKTFPQFEKMAGVLAEHFDTAACPTSYEGTAGRWLYKGGVNLQRYELADTGSQKDAAVLVHFFVPEVSGKCYAVPQPSEGDDIVNIPDGLLQELGETVKVVTCAGESCVTEKEQVASRYQQYQGAYREYRQLMMCADIVQRNGARAAVKGISRSATPLPDDCPKEEVNTAYLNAKGLVEELGNRLFGRDPEPLMQAKKTQN